MTSRPIGLVRLVYMSRRSHGITDTEIIDDIVLPAMTRNRALDITGCIWFNADRFVQVLEGDAATIQSLFDKIRIDARHHIVELLSMKPVDERAFARFGMRVVAGSIMPAIATLMFDSTLRGPASYESSGVMDEVAERVVRELSNPDRARGRTG